MRRGRLWSLGLLPLRVPSACSRQLMSLTPTHRRTHPLTHGSICSPFQYYFTFLLIICKHSSVAIIPLSSDVAATYVLLVMNTKASHAGLFGPLKIFWGEPGTLLQGQTGILVRPSYYPSISSASDLHQQMPPNIPPIPCCFVCCRPMSDSDHLPRYCVPSRTLGPLLREKLISHEVMQIGTEEMLKACIQDTKAGIKHMFLFTWVA